MKSLLSDLKALVVALIVKQAQRLAGEPVVVVGAVVSAIMFVAGHFGVVLDEPTVTSIVAPIVAALISRFFVTPVSKLRKACAGCSLSK